MIIIYLAIVNDDVLYSSKDCYLVSVVTPDAVELHLLSSLIIFDRFILL